jgi:hypothetical protein
MDVVGDMGLIVYLAFSTIASLFLTLICLHTADRFAMIFVIFLLLTTGNFLYLVFCANDLYVLFWATPASVVYHLCSVATVVVACRGLYRGNWRFQIRLHSLCLVMALVPVCWYISNEWPSFAATLVVALVPILCVYIVSQMAES